MAGGLCQPFFEIFTDKNNNLDIKLSKIVKFTIKMKFYHFYHANLAEKILFLQRLPEIFASEFLLSCENVSA